MYKIRQNCIMRRECHHLQWRRSVVNIRGGAKVGAGRLKMQKTRLRWGMERAYPSRSGGLGSVVIMAPPAGSGAEPRPQINALHLSPHTTLLVERERSERARKFLASFCFPLIWFSLKRLGRSSWLLRLDSKTCPNIGGRARPRPRIDWRADLET